MLPIDPTGPLWIATQVILNGVLYLSYQWDQRPPSGCFVWAPGRRVPPRDHLDSSIGPLSSITNPIVRPTGTQESSPLPLSDSLVEEDFDPFVLGLCELRMTSLVPW